MKAFWQRIRPWAIIWGSLVAFFWGWFALMGAFNDWLERVWK